MSLDPRRTLLANVWAQLGLVVLIVVLLNTWSTGSFGRLDLTRDKLYSLDIASRGLMGRLKKPLIAKVYFTDGLQAPYNNFQRIVVDKLDDLAAYSGGLMDVQVSDPTGDTALQEEAQRFGITPVQYRYNSATVKELKSVYMGVALVYGDKQQALPAITQTATLEYDLARAIHALVSDQDRRTVGWAAGQGEPDLATDKGPLVDLRNRLVERYNVRVVPLGGAGSIPEDVDAMLVVGPQSELTERALYQLDQFMMRGGAMAVFVANIKPDLRTMRPLRIFHGMEGLLGHYGVKVNRDIIIDRQRNGMMNIPVRQGQRVVMVPVNTPLIPRATELDRDNLVVKDLDSMLFPFASSVELVDPLPPELHATVLARTNKDAGRLTGLRTIAPDAFRARLSSEEKGSWPLLVSLSGTWSSYFADRQPPKPDPTLSPTQEIPTEDPPLRSSAPTQLVVAGSADFVVNQPRFMLNLVDWMVQDDSLIAIRSKTIDLPALRPIKPAEASRLKLFNMLGGVLPLLLLGLVRFALRRRGAGFRQDADTDQAAA
ncbi:MAG: GldG family protein [Oligoflexia bacterium]|nr:GldG family protein [Oligoflexia bacterium]